MTIDVTKCHAGMLDVSEECPGAGVCQHHGAAYTKFAAAVTATPIDVYREPFADGAAIVQTQIVTTETCCIVVNAAIALLWGYELTSFEIDRPLGTLRTQQESEARANDLKLMHHAAWEVLPPGAYTYFLVNHAGYSVDIYAAWIKAIASDCLG